MGTWGWALNQNDMFCETKERFEEMLRSGEDPNSIAAKLYGQLEKDDPEYHLALFALAECTWLCNSFSDPLRSVVENIFESGSDLHAWESGGVPDALLARRKQELLRFRQMLSAPPTRRQQWKQDAAPHTVLKKGDLFWYRYQGKIAGAVVLDIQNNDFFLIAISKPLPGKPALPGDLLAAKLYTAAWFDVQSLPGPKRAHVIGRETICGDFNHRAGFAWEAGGSLKCGNVGQRATWQHASRAFAKPDALLRDILSPEKLPLFQD